MSTPLYHCMTKAIRAEGDQRQYGLNWAFSRRGRLKVFSDHLECGDWRVNYTEIFTPRSSLDATMSHLLLRELAYACLVAALMADNITLGASNRLAYVPVLLFALSAAGISIIILGLLFRRGKVWLKILDVLCMLAGVGIIMDAIGRMAYVVGN